MGDPYYRFFPGDYMRDTGTLTLLEHGVYRVLLDHYYCEEELPVAKPRLYHLCRATEQNERDAVDFVVSKYFQIDGGRLRNRRADAEILERKGFIELQRAKGKLGGRPKKKAGALPKPKPNESPPSPSPSKTKPKPLCEYGGDVKEIYALHSSEVRNDASCKSRAYSWIERRLNEGHTKLELMWAVNCYADTVDDEHRKDGYKKNCANFFGEDRIYAGILDERPFQK